MTASRSNPDSALIRGLRLLEHILQAGGPVRFSELRDALPGVPDSTLARLLRSLEEHGYIVSVSKSGYTPGPQMGAFLSAATRRGISPPEAVEQAVRELCRRTNESAAFVKLETDHLSVLFSLTVSGAVSVLPPGGLLHFEADHAAALAVLQLLPARARKRLLASRYSRIPSPKDYTCALAASRRPDGSFLDHSTERPGICRMAVPVRYGDLIGALFLCLTEQHAGKSADSLAAALADCRKHLLASLS